MEKSSNKIIEFTLASLIKIFIKHKTQKKKEIFDEVAKDIKPLLENTNDEYERNIDFFDNTNKFYIHLLHRLYRYLTTEQSQLIVDYYTLIGKKYMLIPSILLSILDFVDVSNPIYKYMISFTLECLVSRDSHKLIEWNIINICYYFKDILTIKEEKLRFKQTLNVEDKIKKYYKTLLSQELINIDKIKNANEQRKQFELCEQFEQKLNSENIIDIIQKKEGLFLDNKYFVSIREEILTERPLLLYPLSIENDCKSDKADYINNMYITISKFIEYTSYNCTDEPDNLKEEFDKHLNDSTFWYYFKAVLYSQTVQSYYSNPIYQITNSHPKEGETEEQAKQRELNKLNLQLKINYDFFEKIFAKLKNLLLFGYYPEGIKGFCSPYLRIFINISKVSCNYENIEDISEVSKVNILIV